MTEWQPIATAPRDGTWILAHKIGYPVSAIVAWFHNDDYCGWAEVMDEENDEWPACEWELTHWQPLPAPPEAKS